MVWRVYIKNFGCSSNQADGEVLSGCLAEAGFQIVTSQSEADLLIFNTCAVKEPTENHMINEIKNASKNKKIIVAGCLPRISFERLYRETKFDGAVGPAIGKDIIEVATRVLAGETVADFEGVKEKPPLSLPRQPSNPTISVIPINYGCLGTCAYCCVIHARGKLRSYNIKEIIERLEKDYTQGVKEFWITSQDTASYGRDIHTNLANLLLSLGNLNGDFKIRVGMMTPNLVTDIQNKLIESYGSDRIFKFLHLPIQSGDDSVLERMRRAYTTTKFKEITNAFRNQFPNLTLATDIIVGFPSETEEAFENTLRLLQEIEPDVVNISKFFARPRTAAWEMKDGLVEKEEIKRRSGVVAELTRKLSTKRNQRWATWSGEILIDEKGKVEGSWVGRNFAYKPIVIKSSYNLLGKKLQVKVTETLGTYLKGELIENNN